MSTVLEYCGVKLGIELGFRRRDILIGKPHPTPRRVQHPHALSLRAVAAVRRGAPEINLPMRRPWLCCDLAHPIADG
eukprot:scaffold258929_cov35-Tisochrysis_lutea.AAC.1